jgi:aspartate carbamoyltransferase regulatory subunit
LINILLEQSKKTINYIYIYKVTVKIRSSIPNRSVYFLFQLELKNECARNTDGVVETQNQNRCIFHCDYTSVFDNVSEHF